MPSIVAPVTKTWPKHAQNLLLFQPSTLSMIYYATPLPVDKVHAPQGQILDPPLV